jgi:hypothetical protein
VNIMEQMGWQPQEFYGKPLTYESKRHRYTWGGQFVPSVSSILRRLDKPGLVQWAADIAVEHLLSCAVPHGLGFVITSEDYFEDARKAHRTKKDAAASIGTVLHEIAEHVQQGKEPSTGLVANLPTEDQLIASNCALALKEWMAAQHFGAADLERKVFSKELMYAGRCDRFGTINGRLAVLDFKSGGDKIYPEAWLQMSAYEIALREELGALPPMLHVAVHLNKKTGKCTPHIRGPEHTEPAKEAWRRLVAFDQWMRQIPTEAQMRKVA